MKISLVFILLFISVYSVNAAPIFGPLIRGCTEAIGRGIGTAMHIAGGVGKAFMDGTKTMRDEIQKVFQNPNATPSGSNQKSPDVAATTLPPTNQKSNSEVTKPAQLETTASEKSPGEKEG